MDNKIEAVSLEPVTPPPPLKWYKKAFKTSANFFKKAASTQYSYLFLCFLIPLCLMRLIYIAVGIFPGLDGSVLVLDLNGQYVYFYEALREFIYGDASLLYSFSRALGGEFMGIFAYYVASPLAWIVALFPKGRILEALLVIFLVKAGLCGASFGFYLHKTSTRINRTYIITFSTMYALCSYAVVQQHNSMWIDALIWLPIITYAIEQLIKKGSFKLYVISLAIMLMSHYYIGYMVCIYVALYFFYYYLAHKNNNEIGEKAHFGKSLLRIAGSSVLAAGIAAVVLVGAVYSLQFGKNSFSTPDFAFEIRYDLADLYAKFFPGTYDTVRPDGLPILYCGTLSLLLLPFYYFSKRVTLREKVFSTLFLGVFVVSFTLNPVDLAWHGFQVPNWLNYRYSFMVAFFLLTMAYKAMMQMRKESSRTLFGVGAFLILSVVLLEKFEFKNFTLNESDSYVQGKLDTYRTVWFTIIAVVALCAVIYAIIRAKKLKEYKKASKLLLIVVCAEMLINGVINITALHFDVTYSSYSSYNDFFDGITPIVNEIQEMDTSFYRMEKTHHRKTNDNMTLNINGLSGSTSTLNKETIKLLNNLGYASKSHWSKYLGGNPVNDSILGVKYVVVQNNQSPSLSTYNENQAVNSLMDKLYDVVSINGKYTAYQNPYALSIAYQVSDSAKDFTYITTNEEEEPPLTGIEKIKNTFVILFGKNEAEDKASTSSLSWLEKIQNRFNLAFGKKDTEVKETLLYYSPFERLNKTLSAMIGEEVNVFIPVESEQGDQSNVRKTTIAGHTKYAVTTEGTESYFTISFTAPTNAHLFFYAPSDYPREAKFQVNGQNYGDFMANESNRIKAIGEFNEGEGVKIKLTLKADNFYMRNNEACVYYLDVDAFENAITKLASNQFVINDYSETSFDGTITTSTANACIQTTIPYDKGWRVYVDGEPVEIYKTFDALLAFDIASVGDHTVKMVYFPKEYACGITASAVSIAAFAIICVLERKRKKAPAETCIDVEATL